MLPDGTTSLLIKRWTPGGLNMTELGWNKPVEALAWKNRILHPELLPTGVCTPIVGSVIDPDGEIAWLAMRDVSQALREYDRAAPLPTDQLIHRVKMILSCLARFHALWEQPDRQEILDGMDWLLPCKNYIWRNSAFYATILGKDVVGEYSPTVSHEDVLNLHAFLEWLHPSERSLLEGLLVDRRRLEDCFADLPCSLLHGDLDDRNIGLLCSPSEESELVLIDWERMGMGPAAMDVAKVLINVPMVCAPGQSLPDGSWMDELLDFYYDNYKRAGGKAMDHTTWHRSCDLALIAQALWPFPWALGNLLRTFHGEVPLPEIPGLPDAVMRLQVASSLERMRRMTDLVTCAVNRYLL